MSFWGTLGKIGAGVAAPFTGGASLALIPAIGAIEGGMKGGGWKGALKGGAIGAGEALIPGVGSAIGGAISGAGKAAGGSIMSSLLKQGAGSLVGAAGSALTAASNSSAKNRGATIEALLAQERSRLEGAGDRRIEESDILKKLAQTGYLKGGGYQGRAGMAASLPSFGFGPKAASAAQMAGAGTLENQLMERLKNPAKPLDISKYTKAGLFEKLSGIAGPSMSFLGQPQQPPRPGTPPFVPQGPQNPYDYDTHYTMDGN